MFPVNTQHYREAAIHYIKYGRYDDGGVKNSYQYYNYWDEEKRRCLEGYSVGGVKISGYYYFYLNYCPILKVQESKNQRIKVDRTKATSIAADRIEGFPDFWDVDFTYYTSLDIAEYGISIEEYQKLPWDLNISTEESNLTGGKNLLWLKPRGVGASWKGASMPARNFFLIRDSKSFMLAEDKQFLTGDGIFNKFLQYKNFINNNTAWTQYTDVKNDLNAMHLRASYKDMYGNEKGLLSEVQGVTLKNNPDNARGKRGKICLFEEFGTFTDADKIWGIVQSSMKQGRSVFGTMVGFGTGGTEGKAFEAMEKMFFNPEPYRILKFTNIWDDDLIGTNCCHFTPAYFNIDFIGENGITDTKTARKFIDEERAVLLKSPDPNDVARGKAEHPYTPTEALLKVSSNIFPKAELLAWKTELNATGKLVHLATHGNLEDTTQGVKFRPTADARPVMKFPHDMRENNSGCVTMWETPFRENGFVPDNLYIICVDPYMHDTTTGDSLGAAYVIKNINNFCKPDDMIVASYVGRPATMDLFHKKIRQLAEYYNAKIGFENNAGQALIAYFKGQKKLGLLAPEFELGYNENIPRSSVRRGFGMHIDQRRKEIGLSYLADWISKQWMITEDGEILYNYHKIYDVGLLEELIKFDPDRNCDRISAMIIGMYYMKEIEFKYQTIGLKKQEPSRFFKTTLFQ